MVEEVQIDSVPLIKEENDVEEEVTESYEEVEFLDLNGHTEVVNGVQFVAIEKCDDDEFIDEIIEECSAVDSDVEESDVIQTVNITNRKVCTLFFEETHFFSNLKGCKNAHITWGDSFTSITLHL